MRLVALFSICSALMLAQQFRATIAGNVSDPSGAAVSHAKIVVINTDTNSRFEAVSGSEGSYTVPFLPPGPYTIEFDIQQQFGKDWLLDVGYVGNHQVHNTATNQLNATPLQYLSTSPVRDQTVQTALSAVVANPYRGLLH